MFDPNNLFNSILIIPILNVLIGIYKLLLILRIPGALGFSVIALTILIRLALNPLTAKQLKSTQKLSKLKPELDKITAIYKHDKQRLHQEQLNLYKKEGINPAAGCLPLLVQMPILIALYNLFFQLLNPGDLTNVIDAINKVVYHPILSITRLDLSFLGMNLASKPNQWQQLGLWLLAIPVITALLQYWQTKMMTPQIKTQEPRTKNQEHENKNKENGKKGKEEDMATVMQKQMTFMMPAMIGFFAYSFPVGLSIYWNTFTVFGIIQQYKINKSIEKQNESSQNRKD